MDPIDAQSPLLTATGMVKTFDRTRALQGASFELRAGEVHGLLGANGAGKSTLSKVITGHIAPDAGTLTFAGQEVRFRSTRDALNAGIAIVMQEMSLVPTLTVAENIFLPELGLPGRFSHSSLRRRGAELLASLGQEHAVPLDAEVGDLSAAQRQLVEIAKALGVKAKLIIFDEPTTSLSPSEANRLFDIMSRLRDAGTGLVFVSHRLEEILTITDRVTILREGRTVASALDTGSLTQAELIRHMVGQDLSGMYDRNPSPTVDRPVALEVRNISAPPAVRDVSFKVHAGEILGLGGLVGAGRSETAEAIFGLRRRAGGTIHIDGKPINPKTPSQAIEAGIGFVPEDRRSQNIIPDFSVRENLLLAHLGAHRGFGLNYRARDAQVKSLLENLALPAERLLDASMLSLSGGMQQKIIIARWLLLEPRVLILDEPTKGVDIATRSSIYALLRAVAARGVAVVLISSDFEELLGLADRVVVVSDGVSIADVPAEVLDEEKLTLLAAPRTSMARNTQMLQELTRDCGGAGFWALLEGDQLICLNKVEAGARSDPGFGAGEAHRFATTRIATALERREPGFVAEPDGERRTMLLPLTSTRGHDLGWIGLTVPGGSPLPDADVIRRRVDALAATL